MQHDRCNYWSRNCIPSGAPECTSIVYGVHIAISLIFCAVLCRSLFVLLSFSFVYCIFWLPLAYCQTYITFNWQYGFSFDVYFWTWGCYTEYENTEWFNIYLKTNAELISKKDTSSTWSTRTQKQQYKHKCKNK